MADALDARRAGDELEEKKTFGLRGPTGHGMAMARRAVQPEMRAGWLLGRGERFGATLLFGQDQFVQLRAAQPIQVASVPDADFLSASEQLLAAPLALAAHLPLAGSRRRLGIDCALRSVGGAAGLHRD